MYLHLSCNTWHCVARDLAPSVSYIYYYLLRTHLTQNLKTSSSSPFTDCILQTNPRISLFTLHIYIYSLSLLAFQLTHTHSLYPFLTPSTPHIDSSYFLPLLSVIKNHIVNMSTPGPSAPIGPDYKDENPQATYVWHLPVTFL